jgi:hypothetical protein
MKFFNTMMALMMLVYMSMFVGVAMADPGAGACAAGNGVSIGIDVDGSFTGVNVGQNSETGIYSDQTDYETQCCAETGQEPDCFEPVQ